MPARHRTILAVGALLLSFVAFAATTAQQPTPPSGKQSIAVGGKTVDHSAFDTLLHRHVTDGHVDYAAFAREPAFATYLGSLDRVDPKQLDDAERLAFWLNVYNAFTIQLVAERGEAESIRNINKTFGVLRLKGPWSAPFVHAAGRTLTLDDVMHNILRKEFSEPRIHFALVYAAMGSPPLRAEAYHGAQLDSQLADQGRRFLRESPTKNRLVKLERSRILVLSPIFTYYRSDFGGNRGSLARFLAPWFDASEREQIVQGRFNAIQSPFDWTLNSQANAAEQARHPPPPMVLPRGA